MGKLKSSFKEVTMAVAPVAFAIAVLCFVFGLFSFETFMTFFVGVIFTLGGMTLFMFGADVSMMEVGHKLGTFLITKRSIVLIIIVTFAVGCAVTIAEPDVQVLAQQVALVSENAVPRLTLMFAVGIGVGVLMIISVFRIIFQKSLVLIMLIGFAVAVLVGIFFTSPDFVPVAFDSGGVTTGPMTVPFILAFASGITSVIGSKNAETDSFGMVGLASLGPIIAVLILGGLYR